MIKVSIVLLAGLAGATVLRRRSAAVRHFVLALAVACAAATPFLQRVVPERQVAVGTIWTERLTVELASSLPSAPVVTAVTPSQAVPSPPSAGTLPSYTAIWLSGVVAGLAMLLLGLGRLAWVAAGSQRLVEGPWVEALATSGAHARLARRIRLLQSDRSPLVFTWGLARPRVVLPSSAGDWPAERISVVLRHELAHIRRGDWAVQVVAEVLRAIYWFNPLLWLVCHRLRQESEHACDDAVLETGVDAPDYAAHLLDVARAFRRNRVRWFPAPAVARRSHLERRVRAMLNLSADRRTVTPWTGAAIVAVLLSFSVCVAGLVAAHDVPAAPLMTLATPAVPVLGASPHAAITPSATQARNDSAGSLQAPRTTDGAGTLGVADSNLPPAEPARPRVPVETGEGTATVGGTLLDATGQFMPSIPVTLVDGEGRRYETRSDGAGRFAVPGLRAGEYQVEVTKPGFLSRQGAIVVGVGQQLERDVVAQVGSLEETVVVSPANGTGFMRQQPLPPTRGFDPCGESPVGGCLTPPRKLVGDAPSYPPASGRTRPSGKVQIDARIGTDGFIKQLRADTPADATLAASALAAVRQWRFSPLRLNGIAQECRLSVIVLFQDVDRH